MRRETRQRSVRGGWALVGWATLALVLMIALLLARFGTDEVGIRVVIRATARTSFTLFMLAFVAAPLRRAWRSGTSAWMLANRRYLGVSFAVSHVLHLLAILALYDWSPYRFVAKTSAAALVGGGIGYAFVVALAATSFDGAVAWLGPHRWRRLHTLGMYYLWAIFALSYIPRALIESAAYAPLALTAIAVLVMRLVQRPRRASDGARVAAA